MYVNKKKLRELMILKTGNLKYINGNYHRFAKQLGVDVAQLHRVMNHPAHNAGPKFLSKLVRYCQKEKLDFQEYIFLDQSLHICNGIGIQTFDLTGTD
jgi:hypothetical protein